jgi:4-hydroxy-tetrahydrodipicolinate reductase
MDTIIFGNGRLGRAIADAFRDRGIEPRLLGRPTAGGHPPAALTGADLVVDATRAEAVRPSVEVALAAGVRRFVIATTGWDADREHIERALERHGAAAVAAPNLSLGAAVFLRLVEQAGNLFERVDGFEPYVLEWHRREKRDRPSGTARELVRRLRTIAVDDVAVIRAGSSPGMHLVGFDAPGETIELRLTARDRSAYAAGAIAAADWLTAEPRAAGLHPFDVIVDDLLSRSPQLPLAATA